MAGGFLLMDADHGEMGSKTIKIKNRGDPPASHGTLKSVGGVNES